MEEQDFLRNNDIQTFDAIVVCESTSKIEHFVIVTHEHLSKEDVDRWRIFRFMESTSKEVNHLQNTAVNFLE